MDCADYAGPAARDLNGDGVFNVLDYACDSRVERDPAARAALGEPRGVGPATLLDPQDVLIAFTDGDDDDANGYPDDIVGWDFLDDDNDPFDDVQYGHGTGEARGLGRRGRQRRRRSARARTAWRSTLRVGTSFIADVNRFAQAVIYAVDNDVLVVQEALGTLNKSRARARRRRVRVGPRRHDDRLGRRRGRPAQQLAVVVSARDPRQLGHAHRSGPPSYLEFNGCTNFNAKIDLAIPSVSCSSDATGRAAGMAGAHLLRGAATRTRPATSTRTRAATRIGGDPCLLSADEVKQLMASGIARRHAGRRRRELRPDAARRHRSRAELPAGADARLHRPVPRRAAAARRAPCPALVPGARRATTSSTATGA